jgi:chromate transporter
MAGVTWELGRSSLVDALTVAVALAAALLLIRFKVNSALLVAGGGAIGVVAHVVRT